MKKVKGYDDGLKEKLPSVYEMLHYQDRVATGRMNARYDLQNNSVGFQARDLYGFITPEDGMVVARSCHQTGKVPILS
mgnify:CR=1 FL=1